MRTCAVFGAQPAGRFQGYDAYRAATFIAAKSTCADRGRLPAGLHQTHADKAISSAGLFEAYYDLYLAHPAADRPATPAMSVREPHLPGLRAVLQHNPAARILLEKPACQGHEIAAFTQLLEDHPAARLVVNDQYRYSHALSEFTDLIAALEPEVPISQVTVTFAKNRTKDITSGRFIDRTYGVLGYEWLHMLAVLDRVLPPPLLDAYMATNPLTAELWATYDPRLFVAALTERTTLEQEQNGRINVELASSILGPRILLGAPSDRLPPWRQAVRTDDNCHRHVAVHAGDTRFALHLDPVTALNGWQLERNHHRLTAERGDRVLHDEVLQDSPLDTSIRRAVSSLLSEAPLKAPELAPLRRVASLAELLRTHAPARASKKQTGQHG